MTIMELIITILTSSFAFHSFNKQDGCKPSSRVKNHHFIIASPANQNDCVVDVGWKIRMTPNP